MQVTIVGIRRAETKSKKVFYNYYGLKAFSDYDMETSECEGSQPVSEFSYKDYGLSVGDVVDFQYEPGYEGKAVLSNVVMIRPEGGTPFDDGKVKDTAKKDSK